MFMLNQHFHIVLASYPDPSRGGISGLVHINFIVHKIAKPARNHYLIYLSNHIAMG